MSKIKIGKQSTRAQFVQTSYNEANRTIDVVFATDAPVLRYSWDGPFYEVLDMAGMQSERAEGSLPVLDNHDKYKGVLGIIGRAENVRLEGNKGIATVRFSERDEVAGIIQDVRSGITQDMSVGYNVYSYEASPLADTDTIPTYIARSWEPYEVSFVVVPADFDAKTRSKEGEYKEIELINPTKTNIKNDIMKREQIIAALQKRGISVPEGSTDEQLVEILERSIGSGTPPPANTPPAPLNEAEISARAAQVERSRAVDIREAVRSAGLAETFAETHIKDGTGINEVRALVIAELATKNQRGAPHTANPENVTVGTEQSEKVREMMTNALENRANPATKLIDGASDFRGMSLMDMGREILIQNGENIRGLSRPAIAKMALGVGDNTRGALSTGDFPIILGNTINRTLRKAYDMQTRTFMPFCNAGTMADFRPTTRAQLSGLVGGFDAIPEGGEYKMANFIEGKEVYQLIKYGKMINFTWEMMINDDLGAFTRAPRAIADKAAQKQSDLVYNVLLGNPNMGDGVALFASGHGNLAAAGTAITSAAMSAARQAMRQQKGLEGDYINVAPKYLVVGPAKETEAQQLINATIVATKTTDTNVFRASVEIIVEPRITDNRWFLIGDPASVDTIEYSFLEGEQELFTDQRVGFDVDGLQVKARMVFATKAIDWRAMYENPGA